MVKQSNPSLIKPMSERVSYFGTVALFLWIILLLNNVGSAERRVG